MRDLQAIIDDNNQRAREMALDRALAAERVSADMHRKALEYCREVEHKADTVTH